MRTADHFSQMQYRARSDGPLSELTFASLSEDRHVRAGVARSNGANSKIATERSSTGAFLKPSSTGAATKGAWMQEQGTSDATTREISCLFAAPGGRAESWFPSRRQQESWQQERSIENDGSVRCTSQQHGIAVAMTGWAAISSAAAKTTTLKALMASAM
jgi:hypothetical protein